MLPIKVKYSQSEAYLVKNQSNRRGFRDVNLKITIKRYFKSL